MAFILTPSEKSNTTYTMSHIYCQVPPYACLTLILYISTDLLIILCMFPSFLVSMFPRPTHYFTSAASITYFQ